MKRTVILITILLVVYAAVLELSRNTVPGWIIAAAAAAAFFVIRARGLKKSTWSRKRGAAAVLLLLAVLITNWFVTQPPVRQVRATDAARPAVTDTVHVAEGDLTGVYTKDRSVKVYAGIPYAAPPVGDLRWKEPQPAEKWDGVRKCDTFAPMAMQQRSTVLLYDSLTKILGTHDFRISLKDNYREAMSEDCLYLNVFTPAEADGPLPVLVYIHGGSLMTGQAYYNDHRGEDLAKQGIVFVSISYRLGVFGYYAHEDLAAESENGTTGNYGLLDQAAALSWIHDNISAFGGDPECVTIAGESAGSSSVNALCASPLTEGLFERAIAESSGILAKRPYHTFREMDDALEMGRAIMSEMGVSGIAEMRDIPAEELIRTKYSNSSMTVDGYALTEMPYLTYEKGLNHEKALLNGFNAKEADVFLMGNKATAENYETLLEPVFGKYAADAAALVPAGSIPQGQKFIIDAGGDAKGSLDFLYSAAWFTWSHELWSSYVASQGRPVYEYEFTKTNRSLSCFHAGEIPYAYGNLWRKPGVYDESDMELSRKMQSYWVNFVKTGDPNRDGLPVWEMRTADDLSILELGEEIRMTEDPYREVYPLLEAHQDSLP